MSAIKVTKDNFSGTSKIFDGSLAAMVRGLAIDNARGKIQNAQLTDFTDNSTGTAAASIADAVLPAAVFDASDAGGADQSALNTALGKFENAGAVLADGLNRIRSRFGLPLISTASGTIAAAMTIPAQDKTVASTSGTSAVDYASGVAQLKAAKQNLRKLVLAHNEILVALGHAKLDDNLNAGFPGSVAALADVGAADASEDGSSSIAKTVVDAFLTSLAAGVATIAASYNSLLTQGEITDLTDSTGGTAAATLVANPAPAAAAGAATTSSPKAGFDTALAAITNAVASLAARTNQLRNLYGLSPLLTDSSGGTVSTTLASISNNLTAVDGSSGTSALDATTAAARMGSVNNAISSLNAAINGVLDVEGIPHLTDALEGTVSNTLAVIAATGTGVGGTDPVTMLDSAVDTWLGHTRDNVASLAAKLNAVTGSGMLTQAPLSVVAG